MAAPESKRPRVRENVDGVLLLDKPLNVSSNAALQRAKRALGAAKAGHTGTLDPLATGLLPLAFGESTKFSQSLLEADKTYRATVKLGTTTTTGDAEGEVIATIPVNVSASQIDDVVGGFLGEIEQLPPMYSALKHAGKPLYAYARDGVDIERKRRAVTIHEIAAAAYYDDLFELVVRCSKGTYIRTLAEDIGRRLGCGAHLSALRRTEVGAYRVEDAEALEAIEARGRAARDCLLPVDSMIGSMARLALDDDQTSALQHGRAQDVLNIAEGKYRLYAGDRFLGLGRVDSTGILAACRLVSTQCIS